MASTDEKAGRITSRSAPTTTTQDASLDRPLIYTPVPPPSDQLVPVFPIFGTHLSYLAEGSANIVYRVHTDDDVKSPDSSLSGLNLMKITELESQKATSTAPNTTSAAPSPSPLSLDGKLLRLRKATRNKDGIPVLGAGIPYSRLHAHWTSVIRPLFPDENLVLQQLVQLPEGLLPMLNAGLLKMDVSGLRSKARRGTDLDGGELYGLLVTDMTAKRRGRSEEWLEEMVEVKPKWLAQSPSAPKDWKRCRNCALREMRRSERYRKIEEPEVLRIVKLEDARKEFCPWDLISADEVRVRNVVTRLLREGYRKSGRVDELPPLDLVEKVAAGIREDGTLRRLRGLQLELDPKGPLYADLDDTDYALAMTIRDCTLFIKITGIAEKLEMRLGDLDQKDVAHGRVEKWRATERQLIDGGWYTGTEDDAPKLITPCVPS